MDSEFYRNFAQDSLIPLLSSHDTFNRVISMLNPKELNDSFINWARSIAELTDGEVVAIDGKCMHGSSDEGTGTYTHLVSACASANNLLLGQEKVVGKRGAHAP